MATTNFNNQKFIRIIRKENKRYKYNLKQSFF